MRKKNWIIPYSFRSRLLLFLLVAALASCIISTAGSFMMNIIQLNDDLKNQQQEIGVYLLGLDQKTDLTPQEMLAMVGNETLVADISADPNRTLSDAEMTRLQQGELLTHTSGFAAMPATYLLLDGEVVRIHTTRDFNLFLNILPRVAFTLILSLIFFVLIAILVSFRIAKPVTMLTGATRQVKDGDFTIRLPEDKPGEMGELMRAFNSMTEGLGKTAYLQKDFISNISHEFRTPIASIKGFARLLQSPGLDETSRQEYTALIAQESDRLSRLSDTLLRLSALEQQTGPASLSTFRLDEQLRQVILQLEPTWSSKDIDWMLELAPVTIESDAEMLTQVWINLIQNAVKFSDTGSAIEITLTKTDEAEVIITDHGVGMTQETISRIFDRFYQGDTSHSKEGAGLGLCLTKRILDMLSGQIHVTSTLGEGSSFRICLPMKKEDSHASATR